MADPLADLTRLAKERLTGAHGDAHLNVAPNVWEAMRQGAPPVPRPSWQPPDPWAQLTGLSVMIDETLPAGTWQLRGNGEKELREQGSIGAGPSSQGYCE